MLANKQALSNNGGVVGESHSSGSGDAGDGHHSHYCHHLVPRCSVHPSLDSIRDIQVDCIDMHFVPRHFARLNLGSIRDTLVGCIDMHRLHSQCLT